VDSTTRLLSLIVAGLVGAVMAAVVVTPASPEVVGRDDAAAAQMLQLVNDERAEHGLHPLARADDVADVAAAWSAQMAATGEFDHNPDHAEQICCWRAVAENVAWSQPPRTRLGGDPVRQVVEELHHELLHSPGHRRNLLAEEVDEIGIGVHVEPNGDVWITQNFRASAR
jgi:uncharacterized protein YkwD